MIQSIDVVQSINLDDPSLKSVLESLETAQTNGEVNRRQSHRYSYRLDGCIFHSQIEPGGESRSFVVPTRNISSTGLAFLHGARLRVGDAAVIQLLTARWEWHYLPCEVVRCREIAKSVFDIGVRFATPVNAAEYSSTVCPCQVLVVDHGESHIRQTKAMVADTGAEIVVMGSYEEGINRVRMQIREFDLVLLGRSTPQERTLETIQVLRDEGYLGLIFVIQRKGDRDAPGMGSETVSWAYSGNPLGEHEFCLVAKSFCLEPLLSKYWHDPLLMPRISSFAYESYGLVRDLESAMRQNDRFGFQVGIQHIIESAKCHGLCPIATAADALHDAFLNNKGDVVVGAALEQLASYCVRALRVACNHLMRGKDTWLVSI